MVFVGGKSIAYATSHTLSLSAEVANVNSKDHGMFGGNEVNKRNWSITSENLYTEDDFNTLFNKYINGERVTVIWGMKTEAEDVIVANGDAANYTPRMTSFYRGEAYITDLSATAATGEKATSSCTFTGDGKFEFVETEA